MLIFVNDMGGELGKYHLSLQALTCVVFLLLVS